jgi:alkanesulfonate monooxygenase SsuD/methylene tetrahydromethanopterin reductase-like flavin-dependent oxidoreductase (luciferase family)
MRPPLRFGVMYDFRNPTGSGLAMADLYAQVLEQVGALEEAGYDVVWFTEHHFVEDGYLPSWIPVAGAVLARTRRMRVATNIALLPFYHPLRLAEDLAVLDNLSGGRVEMGVGMGYAPHEFAGFGIPVSRRVSLTEEGLDILKLAWAGGPFSYRGRRYQIDGVTVTPKPVQPGGPPLWMGAMTDAGAERAARYGLHFLPQGRRQVLDTWRRAAPPGRADHSGGRRVGIIRPWLVTDDRERDWPPIRDAERYRMEVYARFFAEADASFTIGSRDDIPQRWIIGDAAEVEAQLGAFIEDLGLTDVITHGVPPGLHPERLTPSLVRFAEEVMPALRARFDG